MKWPPDYDCVSVLCATRRISVAFQVDPFVGEGVYNEWTAKVQRKSEADLPVAE